MSSINQIASGLYKAISESDERKVQPYDVKATVLREEGNIVWVKIPGGVDETPVQKTNNANVGDDVMVRISGGRAWLLGNETSPATDDTVANAATQLAEGAENLAKVATDSALEAQDSAMIAYTAATEAKADAEIANASAQQAVEDAGLAQAAAGRAVEDAATAKTAADNAARDAATANTAATEAKADAAKANTAAAGAVTSLGIVQGVVDDLGKDMDDMQTHVAMMDAICGDAEFRLPDNKGLLFPDDKILAIKGKVLVPSGLHVVPTSNGYFVVLSNDGMYVYDSQSALVATFGENIQFSSIRPQRMGGEDAYIEYYDSDNDGKADSITIVGANISSSTGIPTKVSELENDANYADTTAVADAKKAGTDAQSTIDSYKISNDARVKTVEDAVSTNAKDLIDYITENEEALEELQKQVDGAIDTWYYAVDPTTSNEPAVNWTSEEQKESHLRDLYFNTSNGHTFRWAKESNTYKWIQIEDADAIKALADAAKAQTTADTKRRVFVSQPTPPYDIGDLWVQGSSGDIYKCKVAKTSAQSYAASDWDKASKYTDDSSLNTFKTTTYATDLQQTNEAISLRATKTEAQGYANTAESNAKTDTTNKLKSYYTKTETDSAITQKAGEITASVSSTYETKTDATSKLNTAKSYTDTEITSAKAAIKLTTDAISTEVSKKVGNSEVISRINQSAEEIKIDASKVNIVGVINAINNDTTTTIDGGKIRTGSITVGSLESDIQKVIEAADDNLRLDVEYEWGATSVTLNAKLFKNGIDIHTDFPACMFTWNKEIQNGVTRLGIGYSITVARTELTYIGAVILDFLIGEPLVLNLPNGMLNMPDNKLLTLTIGKEYL